MIHRIIHDEPTAGSPRLRSGADDMASEAWPVSRFKPEKFRAAYWRAENRVNGGILLSMAEHMACPSGMLRNIARAHAEKLGIRLAGGSIVIVGPDGQDELRARV